MTWNQDAARDFLQTIDAECDRLTRLVSNLLDASRLQADAVPVARLAVAADDVLAAALGGVPGADDPERLRIELPDDLPLVTTDPDLLERVLANVVANALRYSPPDRPVRICGDVLNDRVELLVIDQGTTLPAAPREGAPVPSAAAEASLAPGVGIGLAVARANMELLGGQLILEDTPGGGLTVTITVPKARAAALASKDDGTQPDVAATGAPATGAPRPPAQLASDRAGAAVEAHARNAEHSQSEA